MPDLPAQEGGSGGLRGEETAGRACSPHTLGRRGSPSSPQSAGVESWEVEE